MVSQDVLQNIVSNVKEINFCVENNGYNYVRLYEPLTEDGKGKLNFLVSGFLDIFSRSNLIHDLSRLLKVSLDDIVLNLDGLFGSVQLEMQTVGEQVPLSDTKMPDVIKFLQKQFDMLVEFDPRKSHHKERR